MDRDVEKASTNSGTINAQESAPSFAPIQSTSRTSKTQSRAGEALQNIRSHNGYSCDPDEDSQADETEKDPFEVGFENGDGDPRCPRSFGKARKWMIVFVVSSASFCV